MGLYFKSDFHDEFGSWPLAYIPYGGADIGEIEAVGRVVGEGDDAAFNAAWVAAGDRFAAQAAAYADAGKRVSARDCYLRASCFYLTSLHPLFGAPVDPRLRAAFVKGMAAFREVIARLDAPGTMLDIPFDGGAMPACFVPAAGRAKETRPLLILTNGYDATVIDAYLASAVAASQRGYHVLIFDGPGQGAMIIEKNIPLRHDWETVIRAVVDVAETLPGVDTKRIALYGWSLGGYLSLRGASGEPRLAACIADPGLWSVAAGFRAAAVTFGATPEAAKDFGTLDQAVIDRMMAAIEKNRKLRWTFVQRGFWVHGKSTLRDYLVATEPFTLDGRIEMIVCPTLLTCAENDSLGTSAPAVYEALRCPKKLIRFTAAEGAGMHCEMHNRSLLNRNVLDWLDDVVGA